jgi:hypothetical protein
MQVIKNLQALVQPKIQVMNYRNEVVEKQLRFLIGRLTQSEEKMPFRVRNCYANFIRVFFFNILCQNQTN